MKLEIKETILSIVKKHKYVVLLFITNLISLIVLLILGITKTISANVFIGYGIGTSIVFLSYWFFYLGIYKLKKTENYYVSYFLFLLRIGIYMLPFTILYFANIDEKMIYMMILLSYMNLILLPYLTRYESIGGEKIANKILDEWQ